MVLEVSRYGNIFREKVMYFYERNKTIWAVNAGAYA